MKVRNSEIYNSIEPFKRLIALKLPGKVSYELAKLINSIDTEYDIIEKVKNGLIVKFGEKLEDGNMQVKPTIKAKDENGKEVERQNENWLLFMAEFGEVLSQETELPLKKKIAIPETVNDKKLEIETEILLPLMSFIEIV